MYYPGTKEHSFLTYSRLFFLSVYNVFYFTTSKKLDSFLSVPDDLDSLYIKQLRDKLRRKQMVNFALLYYIGSGRSGKRYLDFLYYRKLKTNRLNLQRFSKIRSMMLMERYERPSKVNPFVGTVVPVFTGVFGDFSRTAVKSSFLRKKQVRLFKHLYLDAEMSNTVLQTSIPLSYLPLNKRNIQFPYLSINRLHNLYFTISKYCNVVQYFLRMNKIRDRWDYFGVVLKENNLVLFYLGLVNYLKRFKFYFFQCLNMLTKDNVHVLVMYGFQNLIQVFYSIKREFFELIIGKFCKLLGFQYIRKKNMFVSMAWSKQVNQTFLNDCAGLYMRKSLSFLKSMLYANYNHSYLNNYFMFNFHADFFLLKMRFIHVDLLPHYSSLDKNSHILSVWLEHWLQLKCNESFRKQRVRSRLKKFKKDKAKVVK